MRNVQKEANAFLFNTSERQKQFIDMAGVMYVMRKLTENEICAVYCLC